MDLFKDMMVVSRGSFFVARCAFFEKRTIGTLSHYHIISLALYRIILLTSKNSYAEPSVCFLV
jgi:hypothetical protein